jgi:hypothetical protein
VTVFDGATLQPLASFFALPAQFSGGVYAAAGDVDGDGAADIICGAGAGGGPQVTIYDGRTGRPLASYFAAAPDFTGGVRVAARGIPGGGRASVLTATGPGGGAEVATFDGATLAALGRFFAYTPGFRGGAFVGG